MRAKKAEWAWCNKNLLEMKTLHEVREVITDLTKRLEEHGISPNLRGLAPHLRSGIGVNSAHQDLFLKVKVP